jgi:hypothetical protein
MKVYVGAKGNNKADRVVLHDGVRFLILDRMTETCGGLCPLGWSGDK